MPLPDFEAWAIFARVADKGSFSAAAAELGLSKPTVSKAVARLEARLGTALLHRTSRRLALSEAGRAVLDHARRILAEGEAAEAEAADGAREPHGLVRVSAPLSFGIAHLGPLLPAFAARHPGITVDLHLSDAVVDLVGGGFDLALRISALADSSLRARRLCPVRRPLVAAPAYLARNGAPGHPRDLEHHRGLTYTNTASPDLWCFHHADGEEARVRVPSAARSDNGDVLLPLLLAGEGLAFLPDFMMWQPLADGRLVELLPGWSVPDIALNIVLPPGAARPARVRLFVDHLAEALTRPPWTEPKAG